MALLVGLVLIAPAAVAEDTWLRVTTPDFTVITSLREKEAVAWAGDFAQYVAALRTFFRRENLRLPPLTVVIFARERDFEKYRPLGANGKAEEVDGFFSRQESWAVAGLAGRREEESVRRIIFHEGVHWFLSLQARPNPVWLEEGLAEVFSTFEIVNGQASWGQAIDDHVRLLQYQRPLPLDRVLSTGHDNLFGDDSMRTSMVYAESWAFVHFLMFGKQKVPREALVDYTEFTQSMPPDQAFQKAFGKTYREMDTLLEDYLRGGAYFVRRQPLATMEVPKTGPASKVDVQDALARLAFVAGRWDLAATHARAAIAAAPDDPRGHEVLGFALKEAGDPTQALAEFSFAAAHGSRDFRPYFEVALAAQNAIAGQGPDSTMSPVEARRIANGYERAINMHPRYASSYENLSGVIGAAEPFGLPDRQFLEQGRRIYPDNAMIKVGLAIVARREGDLVAARAQLNEVIEAGTGSANARVFAVRLDAAWMQQDVFGQIAKLTDAGKYPEALALVDERLAAGVPPAIRLQLTTMQRQLQANVLSQSIQHALQDRRWTDARRYLGEMIESDAPGSLKAQARRSLDDLDRRQLGLEAGAKK